jgi:hypothetical protein
MDISMTFSPKALFQRDEKYEGVRRINIYLLRLVYTLMFFLLGKDTWTHILTHQGLWEPTNAVAWCLDSLRDLGGLRNHSSPENATDLALGNILQGTVAYYCGVPALVKGHVGGFNSGRHYRGVLVGGITHRCRTVGLCVCELHLQAKQIESVLQELILNSWSEDLPYGILDE